MIRYRTVLVALAGMAAMVAGLVLCRASAQGAALFPAFVGGVLGAVGAVAAKAGYEHKVKAAAGVAPP